MRIDFASVDRYGPCIAYEISWSDKGSFTIVTQATNKSAASGLVGGLHASIDHDSISLATEDDRTLGELRIGNKSINQLKLGQIGFFVPHTVVLDFTFFDNYKKESKIDLKQVYQHYIAEKLGASLAIRCSSNLEDGEKFSFAGTFDTYLDVPNELEAVEARVLQSYKKFCSIDQATSSHQLQDLRRYDLKLAIMVQKLVKPKVSGFLFTSDPMDPPNNWSVIEYWQGKREQSEGYSITLNNESGKRIPTNRDRSDIPLPAEVQDKLAWAARELNYHFGFPQDAEFVFSDEDEQLYLVQSRPITAFSYSPDKVSAIERERLSEIRRKNLKAYQIAPILSGTNISELFVRAVPLGYSIFKYGFAGTLDKEGGISIGRSRLGYAKLDFEDQVNFFHTVADQARTNIIVDALTFRLQSISREEYLASFVSHYLRKIEQNPAAANYPEDGLYLQDADSERWHELAQEKGDEFRKQYAEFLRRIVEDHAPHEHEKAVEFFGENEQFYRSHLNRDLYSASEGELKEEIKKVLEYLRTSFCPQYVILARLAFLSVHVTKQKLKNLLAVETKSSTENTLNKLLMRVDTHSKLQEPNYPYFERLLKAGKISLWEFLDKFQHLGSLDIDQPRLGEYSIEELRAIFEPDRHYEHGDDRLSRRDYVANADSSDISKLDLEKNADLCTLCNYAGQYMRLREKAKFELLKILYVLKRIVKELARIHRIGDVIFYLEYDELLDLSLENREKTRLLALQRRAYFDACRQRRVPDVLIDFETNPFELKLRDSNSNPTPDPGSRYRSIKGQSVFHGHAEGVCLVAHSNQEYWEKLATYRAEKKEPIIGVFKGVELSYFNISVLAGFTTERGAFLAHAATIARELRIPYVTGIRTDELQDGDYVILDTVNEQVLYRR
ncbi:MAG: hypothetical protein ILNGONEN_00752 [Syntrophorhabdaceae bacterium]|nr:hypothetical protein [Syntrophorhabdaceae bacterium]